MTHIYNGLTALQVAENRRYFGANTLSHAPLEDNPNGQTPELLSLWFVRGVLGVVVLAMFFIPLLDLYFVNISEEFWSAFVACVLLFSSIAIIIVFVATIRFLANRHKHHQHESLNNIRDMALVRVVRDGKTMQVPRMDIVVGDVILLSLGDEVPADAVLLESSKLVVSEYLLNGQLECAKTSLHIDYNLAEVFQCNYVLCGSIVLQGEAVAQVFAVGKQTAINEGLL